MADVIAAPLDEIVGTFDEIVGHPRRHRRHELTTSSGAATPSSRIADDIIGG